MWRKVRTHFDERPSGADPLVNAAVVANVVVDVAAVVALIGDNRFQS